MRTLIIYASEQGHTDRIARRISKCVSKFGFPSDLVNVVEQRAERIVFDAYDAIVIGSPVHNGHYDSCIRACIHRNRTILSEVPTAFFSVRLGIVEQDEDRGEDRGLTEFLQKLRWEPSAKVSFAGALRYSPIMSLEQRLMCWVLKQPNSEAHRRSQQQQTNWDTVDAFATQFAAFVQRCKQPKFQRPAFSFPIRPRREYSV